MRVHVLLFAIVRDAAQTAEVDVEVPQTAVAGDAVKIVEQRFPQISKYMGRAAIAVNRRYATAQTEIAEGDEIAVIPPVSGG
jgi:molybdopterin converting factor subunit 1